ncbi:hypothetical protein [Tabrizicola flagellatus]|uniref:hypothetical protein n=1 Tax=Tabrizicola flagellatus TaxID=2593021 RepID=UPI0011F18547|nr:hypothetical protein [Tabrizicola flagellatus]
MEDLVRCTEALAEQYAPLFPVIVFLITAVVFAIVRTITSLLYGALWAIISYILALQLLPNFFLFMMVGTLAIVACAGNG